MRHATGKIRPTTQTNRVTYLWCALERATVRPKSMAVWQGIQPFTTGSFLAVQFIACQKPFANFASVPIATSRYEIEQSFA